MTFVSTTCPILMAEIEKDMERFTKLGKLMTVAHRVAEYARTQRHRIKQRLKTLCAQQTLAAT